MRSERNSATSAATSEVQRSSQESTLTPSKGPVLSLNQQGKRPVIDFETKSESNATPSTEQSFPPFRRVSSQINPTYTIIFQKGTKRTEIGLREGTEHFTVEWDAKHDNCIFKERTAARREKKHRDDEVHYQERERTVDGWLSWLPGGVRYGGKKDTVGTCKVKNGDWTWSEK
jgi:hypothetical protein